MRSLAEIDKQTLIDDFNYMNAVDKLAVSAFEREITAPGIVELEFKEIFPRDLFPPIEVPEFHFSREQYALSYPQLNLPRRFYTIPAYKSNIYSDKIPDFESLNDYFFSNTVLRSVR
jgi:hypothetical protein